MNSDEIGDLAVALVCFIAGACMAALVFGGAA